MSPLPATLPVHLPFHTSVEEIRNCAIELFKGCILEQRRDCADPPRMITLEEVYHFVLQNATSFFAPLSRMSSTAAPMLQVMIDQACQRRPLPPVPLCTLLPAQGAQAGQILASHAHFQQRKGESLMFDAGWHAGQKIGHRAPVEN